MKVYNKIITEIISKDLVDYIVIKPEYQNNNLVVATITSLGFIPIIANGDKYRFISAETKNLATTLHNSYLDLKFRSAAEFSNKFFTNWCETNWLQYHVFTNPFTRVDGCYINEDDQLVMVEVKYIGRHSNMVTENGVILKQSKLRNLCACHLIGCKAEYRMFGASRAAFNITDESDYRIETIQLAKTNMGDLTLIDTNITYLQ